MLKKCLDCKRCKELTEFHKDKTKNDGFGIYCKVCKSIRNSKGTRNSKSIPGKTIEEKLWDKVDKRGEDECWEWQGYIAAYRRDDRKDGYGVIVSNHERFYVHRLSYSIHFGDIPNGLFVCHHCDNSLCVNPAHLFLGTAKDNSQDMAVKGRGRKPKARIEKVVPSFSKKLSPDDIFEIRKLRDENPKIYTLNKLASMYNVHYSTISLVANKKRRQEHNLYRIVRVIAK